MKQIQFEWKKLVRTKVYPIFLLLTVIFVSGMFFYNYLQQDQIQGKKVNYFSGLQREVSRQNLHNLEQLRMYPNNEELELKVKVGSNLASLLGQLSTSIQEGNWREELRLEIEAYEKAKEFIQFDGARFGVGETDMNYTIRLNEELLARNLPKEDFDLSIQTSIFMKKIISLILSPIGFIAMLFVLGMMITREYEEHNIKLVMTLPIKRIQYMLIKFISLLSASLIWLLVIFGLSYTLPSLLGKSEEDTGNIFTYPLYTKQDTFLNSEIYIQDAIIYSVGFTVFAISLLLFLAFTIRNTILTILSILIILISAMLLSGYGILSAYSPLSYEMVDAIILKEPESHPIGILVLLVSTVILLSLTFILNRKRGI